MRRKGITMNEPVVEQIQNPPQGVCVPAYEGYIDKLCPACKADFL
jgi:hypothetical protein